MRVVIREAAAGDLDDILEWISKDNPRAATKLVRRILSRITAGGIAKADVTLAGETSGTFLFSQKCLEQFDGRCGVSKLAHPAPKPASLSP